METKQELVKITPTEVGESRQKIKTALMTYKTEVQMALPKHIAPDYMIRTVMTAVATQPKLLQCTLVSLIGSVIRASQVGLVPDGFLGHGHLVPFYNGKTKKLECQFIAGYRGLIDLAYRSGHVTNIVARAVYEKDAFDYGFGTDEYLKHSPSKDGERGALTHTYCIIHLKQGGKLIGVFNRADIDRIKGMTKSKDREGKIFGTWVDHEEAMAIKSVIRNTMKQAPMSPQLTTLTMMDEYANAGLSQLNHLTLVDVPSAGDAVDGAIADEANAEEVSE